MARVKKQPQQAFDEQNVPDASLEALLGDYHDAREAAAPAGRAFRAAKKALKEYVEGNGLLERILDGAYIRVGPYVLTARSLEGGGFEIPEWESWTASVLRLAESSEV